MKDFKVSVEVSNAQLDSISSFYDSGYLRFYSGLVPAHVSTALTSQVLLAELRFGATAFGPASSRFIQANTIVSDPDCEATGTVSFYRTFKSDGTTVISQGTAGTLDSDYIVSTVQVTVHKSFSVSGFTQTLPED